VVAEEITSSLSAAERHLKEAETALRNDVFYDCAFHSASATENAANAMILWLGSKLPHAHENAKAMRRAASRTKPELLENEDFERILEKVELLERHVVMSRYPIEVEKGKFVPPHEYYKGEDARRMFEDAKFVVDVVKRLIVTEG